MRRSVRGRSVLVWALGGAFLVLATAGAAPAQSPRFDGVTLRVAT